MNASPMVRPRLRLWGHRGGRGPGLPPENSLGAFRKALEDGADGIELDVFLTRDGELVVFHDGELDQLSNGRGPIEAQTLRHLRRLRLRTFTGELSDERIPTLREALGLVDEWRRASAALDETQRLRAQGFVVNIETKGIGIARAVAGEITKWLDAGWSHHNFLNSSFDMESLREMRRLLPPLPVGALFEGPLGDAVPPWDLTLAELRECVATSKAVAADTINVTLPSLRLPGALELIRDAGARPIAWTSGETEPALLSRAEQAALVRFLTVHDVVLITDFPGQLRGIAGALDTRDAGPDAPPPAISAPPASR